MLWNATTPGSAVESKGSTVCMIGGAGSLPSKMARTKSSPVIEAITCSRGHAVFDGGGGVDRSWGRLPSFTMMTIIQ